MMTELIEKVDAYLDGVISAAEFERWFFSLSHDVEKHYGGDVSDLVHRIENIVAESSSANWSYRVLDEELERAVQPYKASAAVDDRGTQLHSHNLR